MRFGTFSGIVVVVIVVVVVEVVVVDVVVVVAGIVVVGIVVVVVSALEQPFNIIDRIINTDNAKTLFMVSPFFIE